MSLLIPNVGEVELLKRALYGRAGAISGATNASPSVVTATAHGLSNGQSVNIQDVGGTTALNGVNRIVYNVATNTFQCATITTTTTATAINGNGAYTSGGTWSLAAVEDLTLELFSSSTTPAETDTKATYTLLGVGSGYVTKTLSSLLSTVSGWTTPASGSPTSSWSAEASVAEATQLSQSWSFSGTFTVNGYVVYGAVSTTLFWAENFGSTKNITSGDSLAMTPRIGMS